MAEESQGRKPISPAKRKQLQQLFTQGTKVAAQGQFDYATDMFTTCVTQDPANFLYAQNLLGNLQKKYNNNKKGAKMASVKAMGSKASLKKCSMRKDWDGVLKAGIEVLKLNPWDTGALLAMANACRQYEDEKTELLYCKTALESNLNDVDTNRKVANAYEFYGEFEKAQSCWQRVMKVIPKDEEARKKYADLSVKKTIHKAGYEEAESSKEVRVDGVGPGARQARNLSPEEQLEKAIAKDPGDVSKYLELADLHRAKERNKEAEEWLVKALQASGGDPNVQERLEDVQVLHRREQLHVAKKLAEAERTQQRVDTFNRLRAELNAFELDMFRSRTERHPANLAYKYELALRLEKAGNFREAISVYQQAREEATHKGAVMLGLGRCFERIKQNALAMNHYNEAIEHTSEANLDQKKAAVYRAGVLAMDGLEDYPIADKHLSYLAGLDFGYKDVAQRLDKLAHLRDKG